jgi:hypothetical protein
MSEREVKLVLEKLELIESLKAEQHVKESELLEKLLSLQDGNETAMTVEEAELNKSAQSEIIRGFFTLASAEFEGVNGYYRNQREVQDITNEIVDIISIRLPELGPETSGQLEEYLLAKQAALGLNPRTLRELKNDFLAKANEVVSHDQLILFAQINEVLNKDISESRSQESWSAAFVKIMNTWWFSLLLQETYGGYSTVLRLQNTNLERSELGSLPSFVVAREYFQKLERWEKKLIDNLSTEVISYDLLHSMSLLGYPGLMRLNRNSDIARFYTKKIRNTLAILMDSEIMDLSKTSGAPWPEIERVKGILHSIVVEIEIYEPLKFFESVIVEETGIITANGSAKNSERIFASIIKEGDRIAERLQSAFRKGELPEEEELRWSLLELLSSRRARWLIFSTDSYSGIAGLVYASIQELYTKVDEEVGRRISAADLIDDQAENIVIADLFKTSRSGAVMVNRNTVIYKEVVDGSDQPARREMDAALSRKIYSDSFWKVTQGSEPGSMSQAVVMDWAIMHSQTVVPFDHYVGIMTGRERLLAYLNNIDIEGMQGEKIAPSTFILYSALPLFRKATESRELVFRTEYTARGLLEVLKYYHEVIIPLLDTYHLSEKEWVPPDIQVSMRLLEDVESFTLSPDICMMLLEKVWGAPLETKRGMPHAVEETVRAVQEFSEYIEKNIGEPTGIKRLKIIEDMYALDFTKIKLGRVENLFLVINQFFEWGWLEFHDFLRLRQDVIKKISETPFNENQREKMSGWIEEFYKKGHINVNEKANFKLQVISDER